MILINPDLLAALAERLRRLPGPSHRSPEIWHESKSELAGELGALARGGRPPPPAEQPNPRQAIVVPSKPVPPVRRPSLATTAPVSPPPKPPRRAPRSPAAQSPAARQKHRRQRFKDGLGTALLIQAEREAARRKWLEHVRVRRLFHGAAADCARLV
jgi:hypothetical protein